MSRKAGASPRSPRWLFTAALSAAGVAVLGGLWGGLRSESVTSSSGELVFGVKGPLPSFGGATRWLNSPPLSESGLRGKVVLVQFWTYTCINWRRTLPYMRAWASKYHDHGLVVIGVHTPEFSFEGNLANVRDATQELGVEYPVAVDTGHAIWRAFNNEYWPALYLADARGNIRYHQFGEGNYAETELAIQRLLTEAGHTDIGGELDPIAPRGAEVPADWQNLKTPETYTGYELARGFVSTGGAARDRSRVYELPSKLSLNEWALAGTWTIGAEAAVLNSPKGRVVFQFHARDVNVIMAPPARGTAVRFRVRIDGQLPGSAHGADVDERGIGTLDRPMMYQLIRTTPVTDRQLEIEFEDAEVAVFDFTFG